MTSVLRALLSALLLFSASAVTLAASDCKTGPCSTPNDDAFAMLQTNAKQEQISQEDSNVLTKSAGVGQMLQLRGTGRLAAAQKMESSMEIAAMKLISGTGPTLPPELFESIFTEMEIIRKELINEKDGFQTQIDDANDAVAKCNENMQDTLNDEVATAKGHSDDSKNTHNTCRLAESSAYDAKSSSCMELASKTDAIAGAAPTCNCPLSASDTPVVLTCLASNRVWVEENENTLKTQKSDCDSKTYTWSSKAAICDTNQLNYEFAFCSYAEETQSMCSALDTCYTDASASRSSIEAAVKIEEDHIQAVLASAKKIVCFLSILNKSTTENLTMNDFEACKDMDVFSDRTYLNTSVPDLTITYPPADAKDSCQILTSTPGDGLWAAAEYANYTQEWLLETVVCSYKITTTTTTTAEAISTTPEAAATQQVMTSYHHQDHYCSPYPGDAACQSSDASDFCFPATTLEICKQSCTGSCKGISYDDNRNFCILCQEVDTRETLTLHNAWEYHTIPQVMTSDQYSHHYCSPFPGDPACQSSDASDFCFPAATLEICKQSCTGSCKGVSYDDNRNWCILCQTLDTLTFHHSWDFHIASE